MSNEKGGLHEHSEWEAPKSESEKSEKLERWEEISTEVEKIVDKLGKPIDKGIKETVIALRANDFPTSQSCDGHGISNPWVEIYSPAPEGWKEDNQKKQAWTETNLKKQVEITTLLDEFYKNRTSTEDTRLTLEKIGRFGGFRILSTAAQRTRRNFEVINKVNKFKIEMLEFTEFLKNKFLKG